MTASADPYVFWDAAYVLGSLSSSERREYESHLCTCSVCRSAVAELSGTPALLKLLSPEEAAAIDDRRLAHGFETPPMRPQLLDELLEKVRRRRVRVRRLGWAASAAAAAALAIGLVIAVGWAPGGPNPALRPSPPPAASATAVSMTPLPAASSTSAVSLAAMVTLTSQGWGTHIAMTCTYHETGRGTQDSGDRLAMYAVGRDGSRTQLATWIALDGVTATPAGSTSIPLTDIAAVQVVDAGTGEVLLQRNL